MKIEFEDGSFVTVDSAEHDSELLMICMCGLTEGGKKATMSSSILDPNDVRELIDYLKNWLENK